MRAPQYRPTLVDPFRDHLRRRREEDPAVPVLQLLGEITELGYTGSQNLLYRYITQGRVESDRPAISPRRLTRYLLTHPDKLHDHQRERIEAATGACPEMTALSTLISDFAALLAPEPGNDERLTDWIDQARAEDLPHLHAFTRGLELDRPAVNAALTLPFHNGQTEGVNTKTKLIKRQLSLLIGARPEELRALTWDHVDLHGESDQESTVRRTIQVWHSVREGGDTKTRRSRRTLALPRRCVVALRAHRLRQRHEMAQTGTEWDQHGLVFRSATGTELDQHNVRRSFRRIVKAAGLPPGDWTPREMRHSFVSIMSASGVSLEDIARLVGHSGTRVTEHVYRKQIRPVMVEGATAMDDIFGDTRSSRQTGS